jgi:hypothetical protein
VATSVVRARERGGLFAPVDLVDRLEQEKAADRGGRPAAVLSILSTRRAGWRDDDGAGRRRSGRGGMGGKPWVLAMHRTKWDFGKTTINILMISVVARRGRFVDLDAGAS